MNRTKYRHRYYCAESWRERKKYQKDRRIGQITCIARDAQKAANTRYTHIEGSIPALPIHIYLRSRSSAQSADSANENNASRITTTTKTRRRTSTMKAAPAESTATALFIFSFRARDFKGSNRHQSTV